jgi:predicted nucleic acid-binding protein
MRFVDTNILLYSVSLRLEEAQKAEIAVAILGRDDLCLSVQVLQEFYVQATRPSKPDALPHRDAVAFISKWVRFPVQEMTLALMQTAFSTKARWQISYWDAAIIEAARISGCDEVLSEDLNHGQDYGGVRVTNPFR